VTPRRRALTETDLAAWADYVRQVAALPGREAPALATLVAAMAVPPLAAPVLPPLRLTAPPSYLAVGNQPAGVDNSTWGKLRTGKIAPARTLDLHGRTAQNAFHALDSFLRRAHADRLRCVEVITGRGSGETGGVIRRELPLWLNLPPLRPMVLAVTHPHAANLGSVRLLLRRPR
jgi:DNA-nicking Smr family endonuclease